MITQNTRNAEFKKRDVMISCKHREKVKHSGYLLQVQFNKIREICGTGGSPQGKGERA